jgi:hypothetical protein
MMLCGAHELGQTAQTGLRYRHRPLPELRRHLEDHRRHRRSASDPEDTHPSGLSHPCPTSLPRTASRSIPNELIGRKRAKTTRSRAFYPLAGFEVTTEANRLPRKATMPLGLSLSEHSNGEQIMRFRPLHRPDYPKQTRDFHQTIVRLTTRRFGDIAPVRKKGCLNFL